MGYYSAHMLGINDTIKRHHAQVADINTRALPPPNPPHKRPRPLPTPQFERIRPLPRSYDMRLGLPDNLGAMLHDNLLGTEPNVISRPPPCSDDHALTNDAPSTTNTGSPQKLYE